MNLFPGQRWYGAKDGDERALALFRRHYSCVLGKKAPLFVGPGEKMVLLTQSCDALFAWRKFIDDSGQQGVNCAVFRNESGYVSSELILEAEQLAWQRWPGERLYTYVNPLMVASEFPGWCFIRARWKRCGTTKERGLWIFKKKPRRCIKR